MEIFQQYISLSKEEINDPFTKRLFNFCCDELLESKKDDKLICFFIKNIKEKEKINDEDLKAIQKNSMILFNNKSEETKSRKEFKQILENQNELEIVDKKISLSQTKIKNEFNQHLKNYLMKLNKIDFLVFNFKNNFVIWELKSEEFHPIKINLTEKIYQLFYYEKNKIGVYKEKKIYWYPLESMTIIQYTDLQGKNVFVQISPAKKSNLEKVEEYLVTREKD